MIRPPGGDREGSAHKLLADGQRNSHPAASDSDSCRLRITPTAKHLLLSLLLSSMMMETFFFFSSSTTVAALLNNLEKLH